MTEFQQVSHSAGKELLKSSRLLLWEYGNDGTSSHQEARKDIIESLSETVVVFFEGEKTMKYCLQKQKCKTKYICREEGGR